MSHLPLGGRYALRSYGGEATVQVCCLLTARQGTGPCLNGQLVFRFALYRETRTGPRSLLRTVGRGLAAAVNNHRFCRDRRPRRSAFTWVVQIKRTVEDDGPYEGTGFWCGAFTAAPVGTPLAGVRKTPRPVPVSLSNNNPNSQELGLTFSFLSSLFTLI